MPLQSEGWRYFFQQPSLQWELGLNAEKVAQKIEKKKKKHACDEWVVVPWEDGQKGGIHMERTDTSKPPCMRGILSTNKQMQPNLVLNSSVNRSVTSCECRRTERKQVFLAAVPESHWFSSLGVISLSAAEFLQCSCASALLAADQIRQRRDKVALMTSRAAWRGFCLWRRYGFTLDGAVCFQKGAPALHCNKRVQLIATFRVETFQELIFNYFVLRELCRRIFCLLVNNHFARLLKMQYLVTPYYSNSRMFHGGMKELLILL